MKSIYTGNHRSISQYLDITIIIKINIFFQRALEPVLVHIHILWELILINEVCSVIKIYFSQLIIYISLFFFFIFYYLLLVLFLKKKNKIIVF